MKNLSFFKTATVVSFLFSCELEAQVFVQEPTNGSITLTPGRIQGKNNPALLISNRITVWGSGTLNNVTTNLSANFTTAFGANILTQSTSRGGHTAVGYGALSASGSINSTAIGVNAMQYILGLTSGGSQLLSSTAVGFEALRGSSTAPETNTGINNTAVGYQALYSNTTAGNTTAVGMEALKNNTVGGLNIAFGERALFTNTEGARNVAVGGLAARDQTIGSDNVAVGGEAFSTNVAGSGNTAVGFGALLYANSQPETINTYNTAIGNGALKGSTLAVNNTGQYNTALGFAALNNNTSGAFNTAHGAQSLMNNSSGLYNVAIGKGSLYSNTTGLSNTAIGGDALYYNQGGQEITAIGYNAMKNSAPNTGGAAVRSTAIGYGALQGSATPANNTGVSNTAVGHEALANVSSGYSNTGIGYWAGVNISTGGGNVAVGYLADVPSGITNNQLRLGNTSVTYAGVQIPWTATSDRRLKENIQSLNPGLPFIMALRPVSYHRKNNEDTAVEFGLIAQELEATLTKSGLSALGLLQKDSKGYLTIRYDDLLMPLIKAVQEQQIQLDEWKTGNQKAQRENEQLAEKNTQLAEKIRLILSLTEPLQQLQTTSKK